jgi:hypothetical protein
MGFSEEEIVQLGDRLVDGVVAWGDLATVAARVSELLQAGADHVTLSPVTGSRDKVPLDEWRALAGTLIG